MDSARQMMANAILKGEDVSAYTIEILNSESKVLVRMPFSQTVQQVDNLAP